MNDIVALRGKCPNTEFFLVRILPYSVRMRGNTDQKKLRILHSVVKKYFKQTTYCELIKMKKLEYQLNFIYDLGVRGYVPL